MRSRIHTAVLAAPNEVSAITDELSSLGGTPETLQAPTDEIKQVAAQVNAPAPDEVEGSMPAMTSEGSTATATMLTSTRGRSGRPSR